eukprot:m.5832 g.5832  ORF g.5832 m.5832 type:complete len:134 (-) comp4105_c0_seq1:9-410(-)
MRSSSGGSTCCSRRKRRSRSHLSSSTNLTSTAATRAPRCGASRQAHVQADTARQLPIFTSTAQVQHCQLERAPQFAASHMREVKRAINEWVYYFCGKIAGNVGNLMFSEKAYEDDGSLQELLIDEDGLNIDVD